MFWHYFRFYFACGLVGAATALIAGVLGADFLWCMVCSTLAGVAVGITRDRIEKGKQR
jgi:hypothetical protein